MSHPLVEGQQPVVPLPEREPAAIRAAVARLDVGVRPGLGRHLTAPAARGKPMRVEHEYLRHGAPG